VGEHLPNQWLIQNTYNLILVLLIYGRKMIKLLIIIEDPSVAPGIGPETAIMNWSIQSAQFFARL